MCIYDTENIQHQYIYSEYIHVNCFAVPGPTAPAPEAVPGPTGPGGPSANGQGGPTPQATLRAPTERSLNK